LAFLTPCLMAVGLLGMVRPVSWPDFTSLASTVVIEFLFGVMLASFATRRKLPGNVWGALMMGGGFLTLLLMPEAPYPWGFLAWGLPAAAIVTGAVALEGTLGERLPGWLLAAGDASYALYLSHVFLLPYIGYGLKFLHVTGGPALVGAIVLGLGVTFPAAVLVHRYVEKPLMNLLKRRRIKAEEDLRLAPALIEEV
jgi:exopolysaccharide production protein ExoZ